MNIKLNDHIKLAEHKSTKLNDRSIIIISNRKLDMKTKKFLTQRNQFIKTDVCLSFFMIDPPFVRVMNMNIK